MTKNDGNQIDINILDAVLNLISLGDVSSFSSACMPVTSFHSGMLHTTCHLYESFSLGCLLSFACKQLCETDHQPGAIDAAFFYFSLFFFLHSFLLSIFFALHFFLLFIAR